MRKLDFSLYFKRALLALLLITFALTSWKAYQRIGLFGCFDQCFNFVAAYFMLKGRLLYSQIFFNHQPLMAYLSYLIQLLTQPSTIYALVLSHRLSIILLSFFLALLLIIRFRWVGVGWVLFFEATKYYLMGYFFLPEAIIPYLTAYLLGLWWQKKTLSMADYFTAGVITWMIVFLRLPYLPMAIAIYLAILLPLRRQPQQPKIVSGLFFLLLSLLALATVPLGDYFYDLLVINQEMIASEARALEMTGLGILKIWLYPWLIFLIDKRDYFWSVVTSLNIGFFILIAWYILGLKRIRQTIVLFFFLGLAGIRYIKPGTTFYEAFHLLPWYSSFLMATFLLLAEFLKRQKNQFIRCGSLLFFIIIFGYTIFPPRSFIWESVNRAEEFTTNYTHYFAHGTVINSLSQPHDTLFLEQWDDLIYWQSGLDSSYPYSLYTPPMTTSPKFKQARLTMFQSHPPDFYYSQPSASQDCQPQFPPEKTNDYLQFYFADKPTCLYLKQAKLPQITPEQWQVAKQFGFYLPNPDQ